MTGFPRIGIIFTAFALAWGGTLSRARAARLSAPLKILTLNFNSEDAPNDPDNVIRDLRFNAINDWILKNDPDIIVMQEAWNYRGDPSVALSVAREMGYDVAYRVGMGFPGYFLDSDAILAKRILLMTGEKDIELPHSAPWVGDGKTWVIPLGAVSWAVGAKIQLPNGDPLYIYTTHLIQSSESDRADGVKAILQNAQSTVASEGLSWDQANVIIAGDFNSDPREPGPSYLVQHGFEDAFAATHPGDTSCTNCGDMNAPWFDPVAIGFGLVPSQTTEDTSDRIDYVFTHSPAFKALASTLVFSTPYDKVWMSDHFGVVATLGDDSMPLPPNPVHDSLDVEDPRIITITDADLTCPYFRPCSATLPQITVDGPRGVALLNRSSYVLEMSIKGPGHIFTSPHASLNPGEEAAFSFDAAGSFTFTLGDDADTSSMHDVRISGFINVEQTGY